MTLARLPNVLCSSLEQVVLSASSPHSMHFEGDPVSNMTLELFCLKNSAQAGEMPALTSALTDAFASAFAASFIWD